MSQHISVTIDGHIAEVRINRAEKRNAISLDMFLRLVEIGEELQNTASLRAIVLTGEGDHFCAGLDLADAQRMLAQPETLKPEWFSGAFAGPANLFQSAAYVFRQQHVPVIAALRGVVYGAGLQIAMGADLRLASEDTRCCVAEVRLGLIPDMGITQTFAGLVRPDHLKRLCFTGEEVNAEAAVNIGLLTDVVDDPLASAHALAQRIAHQSPDAIAGTKALLNRAPHMPERDALQLEAALQARVMGRSNQLKAVQGYISGKPQEYEDLDAKRLLSDG